MLNLLLSLSKPEVTSFWTTCKGWQKMKLWTRCPCRTLSWSPAPHYSGTSEKRSITGHTCLGLLSLSSAPALFLLEPVNISKQQACAFIYHSSKLLHQYLFNLYNSPMRWALLSSFLFPSVDTAVQSKWLSWDLNPEQFGCSICPLGHEIILPLNRDSVFTKEHSGASS